jgi:DNA-binding response OmpR family regulator
VCFPVTRILVADDDAFGRRFLELALRDAGWQVVAVADGEAALDAWRMARPRFDVIVTDVRMPRLNGVELIGRVRAEDPDIAVLAVSSLSHDEQVVAGLEAGADDYLTKPVSAPVLVAKVRAALRRSGGTAAVGGHVLSVGDLVFDPTASRLTRAGTPIPLTRTELALVEYLMRNPGRIVSPAQILASVWGEAYEEDNEVLRVAVRRVRRKLEPDPSQPRYLRNHVGLGYSIEG